MKTRYIFLLTATAAAIAADASLGAQAAPSDGGMLGTMPHGVYQCALPGDAGGKAFEVQESESFRIRPSSGYNSAQGSGTYILRGNRLTFTSGPKKGERMERVGTNQLKRGDLICTRLTGTD